MSPFEAKRLTEFEVTSGEVRCDSSEHDKRMSFEPGSNQRPQDNNDTITVLRSSRLSYRRLLSMPVVKNTARNIIVDLVNLQKRCKKQGPD